MDRMIFVNLPVDDLAVARDFYTALGFTINEDFSDDTAACVVVSDTIFVMLLTTAKFAGFISGDVAREGTEVINCLTAGSRAEVDELTATALAHGGRPWRGLIEDGPMYWNSFTDPDGHAWEIMFMDQAETA